MPRTMRAGVVHVFGKPLTIEEVPIPTPGPGEVLIKVVATGVCHTDLHAADGDWAGRPPLPFIPGHEGAGVIAARGPGVNGLKEGDAVGVAWLHDACGQCEYCMTGWDSLCRAQHNTGYSVNGRFAEYVIGTAPYVGRLPPARSSGPRRSAEAIAFAAEGKVRAEIRKSRLEDVNKVFADLKGGTVNGRAVLVM